MSHRHPFNATDMKTLMQRILRCHYDPLPTNYTRDLREIVQKVLVKDPARRPTLPEILQLPIIQRRLQAWVGGTSGLPANYVQLLLRYKQLLLNAAATVAAAPSPDIMSSVLPRIDNRPRTLPEHALLAADCYVPPQPKAAPVAAPAIKRGIAMDTDTATSSAVSSHLPPVVRQPGSTR